MHRTRSAVLVVLAMTLVTARGRGASSDSSAGADVSHAIAQAGDRVAAFFSRAQSLVCTETVEIQPLTSGLGRDGFSRTVESELRLWWETIDGEPTTAAQTKRQVLSVNRRPPKKNDPRSCTVPEQEESETQPLSMLLPDQRWEYEFTPAGTARLDGRETIMVNFRQTTPVTVDVREIEDNDECVGYDVNGGFRGRLWIDRETLDVLRFDQRLGGLVDVRLPRKMLRRPGVEPSWTLERFDTSIRFGAVTFTDPDETLILPLSSSTLQVTRGGGTPRLRTQTRYANYKRFLTGGRVVGDAHHDSSR